MSTDASIQWYQIFNSKPKDLPTPEEVIANGHQLCKDFIGQKLKKLNLIKPDNIRSPNSKKHSFGILAYHGVNAISHFMLGPNSVAQASEIFKQSCLEFQSIGVQLESMYPDLYKNVSSQMGINIGWGDEHKISEMYFQFASELLHKSSEGEPKIYWAKIISLLCMASGLAVDCARIGKWDTIPKIIDTFDRIVAQILVGWIITQNGWIIVSLLLQKLYEIFTMKLITNYPTKYLRDFLIFPFNMASHYSFDYYLVYVLVHLIFPSSFLENSLIIFNIFYKLSS